jgi:hypothetical protein
MTKTDGAAFGLGWKLPWLKFPVGPRMVLIDVGSFDCGFAPASRSKILAQDDNVGDDKVGIDRSYAG